MRVASKSHHLVFTNQLQIGAEVPTAWTLPYELTLEIALMLARPHIGKSRFDLSPALHKFRLVCSSFGTIGMQAIAIIASGPGKTPYTTLRLPPKKLPFRKLVKTFLANDGALAKLITTLCITLVPSDVNGPFNTAMRPFKIMGRYDFEFEERQSPQTMLIDDHWDFFVASFSNISRLEINTPYLPGGLDYDFEAAWALVRSFTHSVNIKSATLDNHGL